MSQTRQHVTYANRQVIQEEKQVCGMTLDCCLCVCVCVQLILAFDWAMAVEFAS